MLRARGALYINSHMYLTWSALPQETQTSPFCLTNAAQELKVEEDQKDTGQRDAHHGTIPKVYTVVEVFACNHNAFAFSIIIYTYVFEEGCIFGNA